MVGSPEEAPGPACRLVKLGPCWGVGEGGGVCRGWVAREAGVLGLGSGLRLETWMTVR